MKITQNILNKVKPRKLLCGIGESEIYKNKMQITNYPFKLSLIYPERLIAANEFDSICWESNLPIIIIINDFIFISIDHSEILMQFAELNNLRVFKAYHNLKN